MTSRLPHLENAPKPDLGNPPVARLQTWMKPEPNIEVNLDNPSDKDVVTIHYQVTKEMEPGKEDTRTDEQRKKDHDKEVELGVHNEPFDARPVEERKADFIVAKFIKRSRTKIFWRTLYVIWVIICIVGYIILIVYTAKTGSGDDIVNAVWYGAGFTGALILGVLKLFEHQVLDD